MGKALGSIFIELYDSFCARQYKYIWFVYNSRLGLIVRYNKTALPVICDGWKFMWKTSMHILLQLLCEVKRVSDHIYIYTSEN